MSTSYNYSPSDDVSVSIVVKQSARKRTYYCVNTSIRHQHRCMAYTNPKRAIMLYHSIVRLLRCNINRLTPQLQSAVDKRF